MRTETSRFWKRYDKIQQAESTSQIVDKAGKLYALLIGGEDDGTESIPLQRAYDTLVQSGVNQIRVLESNQSDKLGASKVNLERALSGIRGSISPDDRMFFYLSGHGCFLEDGSPGFLLPQGEMVAPTEFKEMARDIPYNVGVFYFGSCLGGAFAEVMGYANNIGISPVQQSVREEGESYEAATRRAKKKGATNYSHPQKGDHFANELFYYLFERKSSIEEAFDRSASRNASLWSGGDPDACPGRITPQLRWQNADPSELHLI